MIIKYSNPWRLALYVFFAFLKSLQVVFVALIFQKFIDFAQKPQGSLIKLTVFAVCGLLIFGIVGVIYQYFYYKIIEEINLNLKSASANYLVNNYAGHNEIDSSFMTNDLKQIETNSIEAELSIISDLIQFLAAVISAFVSSWIIALVFLIASFTPAVIQSVFGPKIEKNSEKWEKSNSNYTNTVIETHSGAEMANIYDVQFSMVNRLIKAAKLMETALFKTNWTKGMSNEMTMIVAYIFSMFLPFAIGISFIVSGRLTLGTFMMIAQLANNFINPVVGIFGSVNDIKTAKPILQKIKKIDLLIKPQGSNTATASDTFQSLQLTDAGVSQGKQKIFANVNLKIDSGEKVLLQAPSGWGKSTLLNVLIGIQQLDSGSYEVNHSEVNGDWGKLHEYFSFIQQKPFILDDTLKYNITLGRHVSEEDLNYAVEQAGLTDLVNEKGLDYQLGKGGSNLSGGQNQRVEIARALVSKRPILLADEATSSLDQNLSLQIHQTILSEFKGTVIEVAHHISSNEKEMFDQIVDLAKQS